VLQHALCKLLSSTKLEPSVIFGSGVSEYAAAAAAGCLSWDQAIVYGARRGALLEGLSQGANQRVTLRDAKQALASLEAATRPARITLISAQLDRVLGPEERLDAEHWSRHLLADAHPAAAHAQTALEQAACDVIVDVTSSDEPAGARVALLHGTNGTKGLLRALGVLHTRGVALELDALTGDRAHATLSLPTYPFERERHWLDFPERERTGSARPSTMAPSGQLVERPSTHPFVARMRSSRPAPAGSGSGFVRKTDDDSSAKGNS